MGRTINRNPLSVDVKSLDEQYFNFAEFHGINSNKNYITIDQQSFEDAENVYVDQNGQLSTRPVTKRINILPITEHVVDIVKINNLTIYHTFDGNKYYLRFKYKNEWYVNPDNIIIESQIKVINMDSRYIVFMPTNIIGFQYNYELENRFDWYNTDDLIYVPITRIIPGGDNLTVESKNILTDKEIVKYIFESNIPINTQYINGKDVVIEIGDEKFTINFKQNNQIIFTKPINNLSYDVDVITASKNDLPVYLAYKHESDRCYLSYDADIFVELAYPGDTDANRGCAIILSDDGTRLFYHAKTFKADLPYQLWYFDIPSNLLNINFDDWRVINYDGLGSSVIKYNYSGNKPDGNYEMYSTKYTGIGIEPSQPNEYINKGYREDTFRPFGHSPSSQYALIVMPASGGYTTWKNSATNYSETGDSETDTLYGTGAYILIVFNGVNVKQYLGINNTTAPGSLITFKDLNQVKLIVTNGEYHMAVFSAWYLNNNQNGVSPLEQIDNVKCQTILFNKDLIPFHRFTFLKCGRSGTNGRYTKSLVTKTYLTNNADIFMSGISDGMTTYYNAYDVIGTYRDNTFYFKAAYPKTNNDIYQEISYSNIRRISNYVTEQYDDTFDYANMPGGTPFGCRSTYPYVMTIPSQSEQILSTIVSQRFLACLETDIVLTDKYLYYNGSKYDLLIRKTEDDATVITNSPVYLSYKGTSFIYYGIENKKLYSNDYDYAYTEYLIAGQNHVIFPDLLEQFITISMTKNNKLYQSLKREGKVYFPENTEVDFIDDITAMVVFSQTSLGVFLEDNVYEYQYDTSNDLYTLTPTKLKLGCKKGSDVIVSYDGSTILLTNTKGLTGLTYQDFVQSTEQIYKYLTENIISEYTEFATSAIKLYQYKDWLFMYRQNTNLCYVYDARTASWWKWKLLYNITKIVYNDEVLLIQMNDTLHYFDFEIHDTLDNETIPFDWYIKSQKLHFNAPNNYKHIRSLSIITTQDSDSMRFKLEFTNYRNLDNLTDNYVVEYDIDQVSTVIKRVNFVKTNAFQFVIANDEHDSYPTKFVTPDISIKYRITERLR